MSVPFPPFPSRFSLPASPFPRSRPEAVSGVCDSHESPPLQVCAFPSLLFPSYCSLPSFPIDDYVPALFPYWRLCSRPLFLFSIMLPLPLPIFDYALTLSVLDVLMLLLQDCWKCNFCAVSAWVNGPDNYYLCTKLILKCHIILVQESPLEIMSARALLNNECSSPQKDGCSSPQKDMCSRPLKIMGAHPHFSREHFMNLFFYDSFRYSCVFIHLFSIWVFFE